MEKENDSVLIKQKKKSEKVGLSYTPVNSKEIKKAILSIINGAIKNTCETKGLSISEIVDEPVPNISYWVCAPEKRCGFTITSSKNIKYGWRVSNDFKKWVPCSYMDTFKLENIEFSDEDNYSLFKFLQDHCGKYQLVNEITSNI